MTRPRKSLCVRELEHTTLAGATGGAWATGTGERFNSSLDTTTDTTTTTTTTTTGWEDVSGSTGGLT